MLTKLAFKNYRSLRKVNINGLTSIVVLIGNNSSGKTNILDGLYFLRSAIENSPLEAIYERGGIEKVRTIGVQKTQPVEIEFSFAPDATTSRVTYSLTLTENDNNFVEVSERLTEKSRGKPEEEWLKSNSQEVWVRSASDKELRRIEDAPFGFEQTVLSAFGPSAFSTPIHQAFQFITQRWQLLHENFMPPQSLPSNASGDLYVIEHCADNVPIMLDFMKKTMPKQYRELQADLGWLLGHVGNIDVESNERETRYVVKEVFHKQIEAPTISAGTERIVAILTALQALNVESSRIAKSPKTAGLVAIEEPDTSVHPLLFKRLVELFRNYVDGENRRQIILTTHNPHLLDNFSPREVRIVERNKRGITKVNRVSDEIAQIWLDEYGLGDVWMTRALGGVPD